VLTLSYEPECGFQHLLNDGSVTVHFPCPDKLAFEILCFSSEEVISLSLNLQCISTVYNTDILILIQYLSICIFSRSLWLVSDMVFHFELLKLRTDFLVLCGSHQFSYVQRWQCIRVYGCRIFYLIVNELVIGNLV